MDASSGRILLPFLGGLLGGGSLVGVYFGYILRRREVAHSARIARVIERKADVYKRCAGFLRSVRGIPIVVAVDNMNELADEMLLWASDDVYKKFSALVKWLAKDMAGNGSDWIQAIFPTLQAMANDINPDLKLRASDIIPHITFVDGGLSDKLWQAAWQHPQEFNAISLLLKGNAALMHDLVRHRFGDYDSVSRVILSAIGSTEQRQGENSTRIPPAFDFQEEIARAILMSLKHHPSNDSMLTLGQIAAYAAITNDIALAYLEILGGEGLVEFGRSPGGRPHFMLTEKGVNAIIGEDQRPDETSRQGTA